jgi:REP element-mobilizing transposase RayT
MARRLRIDYVDAWQHVSNRGLAKRPMFENADDVARFLDLLGEAVSRGLIEIHAFCVMVTHFHLLIRSTRGELSNALQWIQNQYVRWFNRSRRRDGALVHGRFGSQLVEDSAYWETVVHYIDQNPVSAKMCVLPSDHAHGSAAAYRGCGGPDWLTRDLVEAVVCEAQGLPAFDATAYDEWSMGLPAEAVKALVECRSRTVGEPLPCDGLLRSASLRQQSWMQFKARLADGTSLGAVVLVPDTVRRLIAGCRRARPGRRSVAGANSGSYWGVLEAGMLRDFCASGLREIADRLGISPGAAQYRCERHCALAATESDYRTLVSRLARRALTLDFPPPRRALDIPVRLPALQERLITDLTIPGRTTSAWRGT